MVERVRYRTKDRKMRARAARLLGLMREASVIEQFAGETVAVLRLAEAGGPLYPDLTRILRSVESELADIEVHGRALRPAAKKPLLRLVGAEPEPPKRLTWAQRNPERAAAVRLKRQQDEKRLRLDAKHRLDLKWRAAHAAEAMALDEVEVLKTTGFSRGQFVYDPADPFPARPCSNSEMLAWAYRHWNRNWKPPEEPIILDPIARHRNRSK